MPTNGYLYQGFLGQNLPFDLTESSTPAESWKVLPNLLSFNVLSYLNPLLPSSPYYNNNINNTQSGGSAAFKNTSQIGSSPRIRVKTKNSSKPSTHASFELHKDSILIYYI